MPRITQDLLGDADCLLRCCSVASSRARLMVGRLRRRRAYHWRVPNKARFRLGTELHPEGGEQVMVVERGEGAAALGRRSATTARTRSRADTVAWAMKGCRSQESIAQGSEQRRLKRWKMAFSDVVSWSLYPVQVAHGHQPQLALAARPPRWICHRR